MDRKTFILCYLISIATILGSGLLGLPVSIAQSGILPFLFTFTLNLLAQIAVVSLILELLQTAHIIKTRELNAQIKQPDNAKAQKDNELNQVPQPVNNNGQMNQMEINNQTYDITNNFNANQNYNFNNNNNNEMFGDNMVGPTFNAGDTVLGGENDFDLRKIWFFLGIIILFGKILISN